MKDRKRIKILKANLKAKNQEIKHTKKLLREIRHVNDSILRDYHRLVDDLKAELNVVNMALKKSQARKCYQFIKI